MALDCVIAIPVYKKELNELESLSLRQCLRVFGNVREIALFSPQGLDVKNYENIFASCGVPFRNERFHDRFYTGTKAYSELLLSRRFYERFSSHSFMLIYQLDAYVFRDELDAWCSKGFDYVGAPFVTLFRKGTHADSPDTLPWGVGNGGLSLRRIDAFLSAFSGKGRVFSLADYFHNTVYRKNRAYTLLKKVYYGPRYLFDWAFRNNVAHYIESTKVNEDIFWCFAFNDKDLLGVLSESVIERLFLRTSRYRGGPLLKIAPTTDALAFAFDEAPSRCLELSNGTLPMGCHAFNKQLAFWSSHIPELPKE